MSCVWLMDEIILIYHCLASAKVIQKRKLTLEKRIIRLRKQLILPKRRYLKTFLEVPEAVLSIQSPWG